MTIGPDNDNVMPIGLRLGSERLYDSALPPAEEMNLQPVEDPPKPKRNKGFPRGKPRKLPPMTPPNTPPAAKRESVNWRDISSSGLELLGVALVTIGCALIAFWLAFIVGGALLVLLGVATGREVTK